MKRVSITLLLLWYSSAALAQTPRLLGGAGFFRFGYANLFRVGQTLDQFTPSTGIGNDFIYMGGEGYARLNKYVVGGGGYGMARQSLTTATYHAEPFSGGGYLFFGRVLVNTHRFWLYPTLGAGVAIVGLSQSQQQGQTIRESSFMLTNVNAQLGINADWLVAAFGDTEGYGGPILGIRTGVQLSPLTSGWHNSGEIPMPSHPHYAINGYYVTMVIGVGGFHK